MIKYNTFEKFKNAVSSGVNVSEADYDTSKYCFDGKLPDFTPQYKDKISRDMRMDFRPLDHGLAEKIYEKYDQLIFDGFKLKKASREYYVYKLPAPASKVTIYYFENKLGDKKQIIFDDETGFFVSGSVNMLKRRDKYYRSLAGMDLAENK